MSEWIIGEELIKKLGGNSLLLELIKLGLPIYRDDKSQIREKNYFICKQENTQKDLTSILINRLSDVCEEIINKSDGVKRTGFELPAEEEEIKKITLNLQKLFFKMEEIEAFQNVHPLLFLKNKNVKPEKDVKPEHVFYEEGEYWRIGIGNKVVSIKHLQGLSYIHYLLQKPWEEILVSEIENLGKITNGGEQLLSGQPKIDAKARKDTEEEIKNLREQLEYDNVSLEKKEDIEETIQKCEKYLKDGKRKFTVKNERRLRVYKNITNALKKIKTIDGMDQYLNKDTIKTGFTCKYKPFSDTEWQLFSE